MRRTILVGAFLALSACAADQQMPAIPPNLPPPQMDRPTPPVPPEDWEFDGRLNVISEPDCGIDPRYRHLVEGDEVPHRVDLELLVGPEGRVEQVRTRHTDPFWYPNGGLVISAMQCAASVRFEEPPFHPFRLKMSVSATPVSIQLLPLDSGS